MRDVRHLGYVEDSNLKFFIWWLNSHWGRLLRMDKIITSREIKGMPQESIIKVDNNLIKSCNQKWLFYASHKSVCWIMNSTYRQWLIPKKSERREHKRSWIIFWLLYSLNNNERKTERQREIILMAIHI